MFQLAEINLTRSTMLRWGVLVLVAKLALFTFFTVCRSDQWPAEDVVKGIALVGGDTPQYYKPCETFIQGEGYQSICRMPGLLPFYVPLRLLLDEANTKVTIVFIQLLFDVLATLMLAMVAARIFGSQRAFIWTCMLYGLSTFVSIRSHYLLSDAFNTSMLIFSIYFLSNYLIYTQRKALLIAGVFIAWSLFFRPVVVVAYPCIALLLFVYQDKKIWTTVKSYVWFVAPTLVVLSLWTVRNISSYQRPIVLIAGADECMNKFTPQQQAIRDFIITMGEDFQPWSAGSGAEWFLQKKVNYKEQHPFSENDFTGAYNLDSLVALKENYVRFVQLEPNNATYSELGNAIVNSAHTFATAYKKEHATRYYVMNRINFIRMFLFPNRLDDLPLPAMSDMNMIQKGAKAASYILLLLVHTLACVAMLYFLWKKRWMHFVWGLLPFAFVALLGYMGFIEQRYLTAAYPFMVLLVVGFVVSLQPARKV